MKPTTSPVLLGLFSAYSRWYIGRNFHSVRVSNSSEIGGQAPAAVRGPLIFYLNHASWWDPLIGLLLARRLWRGRRHYAPIDEGALARYRILSRIGFFGVEASTRRGAGMFLRNSLEILGSPNACLWITSEGEFRDPRTRPVELRPGLAHLGRRVKAATLVPLAIEYPFWEERFPEVLCRFGTPTIAGSRDWSIEELNKHLAEQMRINQDALAREAIAREPGAFRTILAGRAGVGGVYDAWRWGVATLRGRRFQREHGDYPGEHLVDRGAAQTVEQFGEHSP